MIRRVKNPEYHPVNYAPVKGLKIKEKAYDRAAKQFLDHAEGLWKAGDGLDTAVRDVVCEGLAYLVHTGYDCQACSIDLALETFHQFIATKTADWFRSRGCAEWFCQGAATLFNTSRPRVLQWSTSKPRTTIKGGRKRTIKVLKAVQVA